MYTVLLTKLLGGAVAGGDVASAIEAPKPSVKSEKVKHEPRSVDRSSLMKEYAELAAETGVPVPDLAVERFKEFLRVQDWGIFQLAEVVAYMDAKAAAESKDKCGWQWHPLRAKDEIEGALFGTQPRRRFDGRDTHIEVGSDFYRGPATHRSEDRFPGQSQGMLPTYREPGLAVYDKTIPLHALKKVSAVERGFKEAPVSFFVCDYALAPAIQYPDPFLMAVVKNSKLDRGVGRFVIDFWDEPGFGVLPKA